MTDKDKLPLTYGIHHLGLTVPNINETGDFFINILGFQLLGRDDAYPSLIITDGTTILTLWQVTNPDQLKEFDRHTNVGLHHFALNVGSLENLNKLFGQINNLGTINIEFAPEPMGSTGLYHTIFYLPGGIRAEFTGG